MFPIDMTQCARAVVTGEDTFQLILLKAGGGKEVLLETDDKLEALQLGMILNAGFRGDCYDKDAFTTSVNKEYIDYRRETGQLNISVWRELKNLIRRLFA
jgi:hypothetical protein